VVLQLNVGEVKYAPKRDVVYLFPAVIRSVAARLEDAPFAPLHVLLRQRGISQDDLGEALGCYIKYMNAAHQNPELKMWDVLEASGWNACKPEAQIAVMFYTGIIFTGAFFEGVREVVPLGGRAPAVVTDLVVAGQQLDAYLAMPCWQKWLYRKFKWLRRLLMRGKGIYVEV